VVGTVQEVLNQSDLGIPRLKQELDRHAKKARAVAEALGTEVFAGKITILGDRRLPFKVLEKVMYTCSQAEFSDINLAVIQKDSPA